MPQTPLTQSIKGVPLFVFALGPHNPLGGPGSILFPLLFVSTMKCVHACKMHDVAHIINFHCGICILECNIRISFWLWCTLLLNIALEDTISRPNDSSIVEWFQNELSTHCVHVHCCNLLCCWDMSSLCQVTLLSLP